MGKHVTLVILLCSFQLTNLGIWFVTRIFLLELGRRFWLWGRFDGRYFLYLLAFLSYLARNLTHFSKLLEGSTPRQDCGKIRQGVVVQCNVSTYKHTYSSNTLVHQDWLARNCTHLLSLCNSIYIGFKGYLIYWKETMMQSKDLWKATRD